MKLQEVPIGKLRPSKYNPRIDLQPGDDDYEKIKKSIEEFGLVDALVWNSHNGVLIGGHQRLKVLKDLGWKSVPVSVVTIKDEKKEKLLNLALNRVGGDWDDEKLSTLIDQLVSTNGIDIALAGFDQDELDRYLDNIRSEFEDKADDIPEVPKKPVTKMGDVWKLGDHLVICGDSTDPKVIARIKKQPPINLTFTSPPYWVGMEYESQKSIEEIESFIVAITNTIQEVTSKEFGRVIINTGLGNARLFTGSTETMLLIDKWVNALKAHEWYLRHMRMWVKGGGLAAPIAPRNDVIDQHCEFIATFFSPDGKQRGMNKIDESWAQQGYIDDLRGDKSAGGVHCAAFPVELPRRFIRLYTKPAETVFDPFGGSGTTLIAAEGMERKSILVELSPGYVDVIIERFKNNSQKKVSRV